MSQLTITRQQFPGVVPDDAKVGDPMSFIVSGTIRRIEADLIDVSSLNPTASYEHALGPVETEIAVSKVVPT